ncbi:L-aspartate oxidase [Schumannella sp. 10F1B-5-1]|uniref:L-aspartate oxidase n=1 Tax=Schumannella sp. 10F1B-5-1 TaxID=2590780 RepID=UPI001130C9B2|nr:L-aspartate oxidase [Schumannella sp. 10F1B-5-1]TPW70805.1 L-aspartate oxidase [Schumannella sp. 10F1B-5-1]
MRVLVIGSGIAGLIAAYRACRDHDVVLVTKAAAGEANTAYAQGGIAAALFPDDSAESHADDTLRAADGLADPEAVRVLTSEGPQRVRDLIGLGVAFDRDPSGSGLARGHEAAHSARRVVHAGGDATGREIERVLLDAVRRSAVALHERTALAELIVRDGRVVGAELLGPSGLLVETADAVILATGGAGQLFRHTTNPAVTTGDGVAAAWRAGAELTDVEFYQFHPTALAVPGTPLISEAVRGDGAVLLDEQGRRFMLDVHPDGELAPRDVVARGIADAMARQGGRPVLLDATSLGGAYLEQRFPGLTQVTRTHGFDWATTPIPVTPAAHYWMGGVRTDVDGRTSIPGLFCVGEAACTGVHGANRLASNSLLESLVFAERAAGALDAPWQPLTPADDLRVIVAPAPAVTSSSAAPSSTARRAASETQALFSAGPVARARIQELMWSHVGLERDAAGLAAVLDELAARPASRDPRETLMGLEDRNLADLAALVATAALHRTESRGAHHRRDHPVADPSWLRRVTWTRTLHVESATPEFPTPPASATDPAARASRRRPARASSPSRDPEPAVTTRAALA